MDKDSATFTQYKGNLSPKQITDGMNAAVANAKQLRKDAVLLHKHGRFARSVSLSILSVEESGKIPILRQLSIATDGKQLKDCWKRYRKHTEKNVMIEFPDLVGDGGRVLEDFLVLFNGQSRIPRTCDQLKQIGFYTDCLGKSHWSIPENVIDKALSESMLKISGILLTTRHYSEQEVILWIKHMKPVENESLANMKKALRNWYTEMKSNGLLNTISDQEIDEYLGVDMNDS